MPDTSIPVEERTFDWRPNPDPRSQNFLATVAASNRQYRYWKRGPTLDQGREGACVGHGVIGSCLASPITLKIPHPQATAFGMYYGSRRIDEWPGEDYDGTSVNAGMKLARELGLITGWEWADNIERAKNVLLEEGTLVCGMNWDRKMDHMEDSGLLNIGGGVRGGHCIYWYGYARNRKMGSYTGGVFAAVNSWGRDYGKDGRFYMREEDVAAKFEEGAEFAIPRI